MTDNKEPAAVGAADEKAPGAAGDEKAVASDEKAPGAAGDEKAADEKAGASDEKADEKAGASDEKAGASDEKAGASDQKADEKAAADVPMDSIVDIQQKVSNAYQPQEDTMDLVLSDISEKWSIDKFSESFNCELLEDMILKLVGKKGDAADILRVINTVLLFGAQSKHDVMVKVRLPLSLFNCLRLHYWEGAVKKQAIFALKKMAQLKPKTMSALDWFTIDYLIDWFTKEFELGKYDAVLETTGMLFIIATVINEQQDNLGVKLGSSLSIIIHQKMAKFRDSIVNSPRKLSDADISLFIAISLLMYTAVCRFIKTPQLFSQVQIYVHIQFKLLFLGIGECTFYLSEIIGHGLPMMVVHAPEEWSITVWQGMLQMISNGNLQLRYKTVLFMSLIRFVMNSDTIVNVVKLIKPKDIDAIMTALSPSVIMDNKQIGEMQNKIAFYEMVILFIGQLLLKNGYQVADSIWFWMAKFVAVGDKKNILKLIGIIKTKIEKNPPTSKNDTMLTCGIWQGILKRQSDFTHELVASIVASFKILQTSLP